MVELINEELPRFLLRFSLGDVVGDRSVSHDAAIAVMQRGKTEDDLDDGSVFPKPARIASKSVAALRYLRCERLKGLTLILARTENPNRLAYDLMRGITVESCRAWIPIFDDEVRRKR